MNQWGGQPLPISASAWHNGVLHIRLSGAAATVAAACNKLGGENIGAMPIFGAICASNAIHFFSAQRDDIALWRLSLPSATPSLDLAGEPLIEWGGALRWLKVDADADSAHIRAAAEQAGGHATLFRGGDKRGGVFHPLTPTVAALHRNLKNAFDPAGIFNPGRMYAGLV